MQGLADAASVVNEDDEDEPFTPSKYGQLHTAYKKGRTPKYVTAYNAQVKICGKMNDDQLHHALTLAGLPEPPVLTQERVAMYLAVHHFQAAAVAVNK